MALHSPTRKIQAAHSIPSSSSLSPTTGNVGLRRPTDRFALKSSFFSSSIQLLLLPRRQQQQKPLASASPKFSMRVASKQAYICRDCGYIYNDRTPFEKVADSYFCPVCGAPKRRFKPYAPPVSKDSNQTDARKARKAELQRDEAVGKALPIAIVVGVVALVGLYLYLNNAY